MNNNAGYKDWVCQIVSETIKNKGRMLDLFSNTDYRHAGYLKEQFEAIDAVDQRFGESKHIGNVNLICSRAENFNPSAKYSLIMCGWPEAPFYKYFFDEALRFKKNLDRNGRIICIFQDIDEYKNPEEEMYRLFSKMFLIDQEQPYLESTEIIKTIEGSGLKIEGEYFFHSDIKREAMKLDFDEIKKYDDSLLTPKEKERIFEIADSVKSWTIGKIKALILSV